jgi:hypothetical protein
MPMHTLGTFEFPKIFNYCWPLIRALSGSRHPYWLLIANSYITCRSVVVRIQDVFSWIVTECTPRSDPGNIFHSVHFALCTLFLILRVVFLYISPFRSLEFSQLWTSGQNLIEILIGLKIFAIFLESFIKIFE